MQPQNTDAVIDHTCRQSLYCYTFTVTGAYVGTAYTALLYFTHSLTLSLLHALCKLIFLKSVISREYGSREQ